MKAKITKTFDVTLNEEEAILICSALEALRQVGLHSFTGKMVTSDEKAKADQMRRTLAEDWD